MTLGSYNLQCVSVNTSMLTHPATSSVLLTIANGITWLPYKVVYQHESILKLHLKRDTNYMYVRQEFFSNSLPEKFEGGRGSTYNHTQG